MIFKFKGIKLKLTVGIVAAVLSTAVALTIISTVLVSYTMRVSLQARSGDTAKILQEALLSRQHEMAIRAETNAEEETLQRDYQYKDVDREQVEKDIADRVRKAGASFGFMSDLTGAIVAVAAGKTSISNEVLAKSAAIPKARSTHNTATTIEFLERDLFVVAATPVKQYGQVPLGYLVMGSVLDEAQVAHLKDASGAGILLVHDGKVIRSSFTLDTGMAQLSGIEKKLEKEPLLSLEGLQSSGEALLASAMPLRAADQVEAALVFVLSAKVALALRQQMIYWEMGSGLLIMGLFAFLGLLIARRVSDPIVEIEQSFRDIAVSGDLSRRITKIYPDEVGRMAESFNQMQQQIEQLHERVVTAERRMRDELTMASAVQEMLVPIKVVDAVRCQVASHLQTSSETGGDWFTVINSPEFHVTTVIVADVTGHGAPSALVTAILHGFFKATEKEISSLPAKDWAAGVTAILHRLNRVILESTHNSLASTLFLFTFDHRTLQARYINAGHLPPLFVQQIDGHHEVGVVPLAPSSPIGQDNTPEFSLGELQFAPEQLFLLYTDGLIECTNANNQMYGLKRLRKRLMEQGHQDARTVRDIVLQDALGFFGDTAPNDDITIVVGRVR